MRRLIFFLNILLVILIAGCGSPKSVKNAQGAKIDRSSPEVIVKGYYEAETKFDKSELEQFLYEPDTSGIEYIKNKIKCFKVKDIKFEKLLKLDKKDNLAGISCIYSTSFDTIKKLRYDIEFVALIRKNNGWYILNDYNKINDQEYDWIDKTKLNQKNELIKTDEVKNIIESQLKFDQENKLYMEKCQENMNTRSK